MFNVSALLLDDALSTYVVLFQLLLLRFQLRCGGIFSDSTITNFPDTDSEKSLKIGSGSEQSVECEKRREMSEKTLRTLYETPSTDTTIVCRASWTNDAAVANVQGGSKK